MLGHRKLNNLSGVIDPKSPWKAILTGGGSLLYGYKKSRSEWLAVLARANRGDAEAEWDVAECYGDGCKDGRGNILVRRSRTKAMQWLRRSAEHGCASAQNNLGIALGVGSRMTKKIAEAFFWLKRAYRGGDSYVASNIAVTYRQIGKPQKAVEWFKKAVDGRDGDALIQLGIHYYWGIGIRKNPDAGVRCFRKAIRSKWISEGGRDDAFFFLGVAYYEGKGLKASLQGAIKLLERANIDDDHPAARKLLHRIQTWD